MFQSSSAARAFGFENEIYVKIFFKNLLQQSATVEQERWSRDPLGKAKVVPEIIMLKLMQTQTEFL